MALGAFVFSALMSVTLFGTFGLVDLLLAGIVAGAAVILLAATWGTFGSQRVASAKSCWRSLEAAARKELEVRRQDSAKLAVTLEQLRRRLTSTPRDARSAAALSRASSLVESGRRILEEACARLAAHLDELARRRWRNGLLPFLASVEDGRGGYDEGLGPRLRAHLAVGRDLASRTGPAHRSAWKVALLEAEGLMDRWLVGRAARQVGSIEPIALHHADELVAIRLEADEPLTFEADLELEMRAVAEQVHRLMDELAAVRAVAEV